MQLACFQNMRCAGRHGDRARSARPRTTKSALSLPDEASSSSATAGVDPSSAPPRTGAAAPPSGAAPISCRDLRPAVSVSTPVRAVSNTKGTPARIQRCWHA